MTIPSDISATLASALRERLAIIADRDPYSNDPAAHLNCLQEVSTKIAELAKQLPANTDPQLAHYLQRCSFDKALAFLESKLN